MGKKKVEAPVAVVEDAASTSTATTTTMPPDLWQVAEGDEAGWYYRDHEGSEFGPFPDEATAAKGLAWDKDDVAKRRHLATPELEAKLRQFAEYDNLVATLEEQLGDAKARRKYIGEHEIVELVEPELAEHGVRLSDGSEWIFDQVYETAIRSDNKEAAFTYLKEIEADGMLKRSIILSFGKDSAAQVANFRQSLAHLLPQYEVSVRAGKAPETLLLAIRELLERAGLTPTVAVEEKLELPGATARAWMIKQLKLGKTIPNVFEVYAPLKPKMVPLAALPTEG